MERSEAALSIPSHASVPKHMKLQNETLALILIKRPGSPGRLICRDQKGLEARQPWPWRCAAEGEATASR